MRDVVGEKIDMLNILKISSKNKLVTHWKYYCRCDCGKFVCRSHKYLVWEKRYLRSCGCNPNKKRSPCWKGCGDIPGRYFAHIKRSAKSRNLEFDIKIEDVSEVFVKQNKKCIYTGLDLRFANQKETNTASLDRIDSTKGYLKTNLQFVHKTINSMKSSLLDKEFIHYCCLVAKNQKYKLKINKQSPGNNPPE